eukprot:SAG11_NODE_585_length_8349_cov_38.121939_8_plen_121_part_00
MFCFCHRSWDTFVWTDGSTGWKECATETLSHGGEDSLSSYGDSVVMIDFDDETCTAVQMIKTLQFKRDDTGDTVPFVDVFTKTVSLDVVLFNGEVGIYTLVHFIITLDRGGEQCLVAGCS